MCPLAVRQAQVSASPTNQIHNEPLLHDFHVLEGRLQPVTEESIDKFQAVMMAAELPSAKFSGRYTAQIQSVGFLDVVFSPDGTDDVASGKQQLLTIPLVMSKTKYVFDERRGELLISITVDLDASRDDLRVPCQSRELIRKQRKSETWVFSSKNRLAGLHFAEQLKMNGAIIGELTRTWNVSETILGTGSLAEVRKATRKIELPGSGPRTVAVKITTCSKHVATSVLQREVEMLVAAQQHPNVIAFQGLFSFGDAAYAVAMPYCNGGDVHDQVSQHPFDEERALHTLQCVLAALEHIHGKGIVHRDLKAENVVVDMQTQQAMLSDFGIAHFEADRMAMSQRQGSPGYIAPELIAGQIDICSYGLDVFSCGVFLFFCACGRLPFAGRSIYSIFQKTLACKINFGISTRFEEMSAHLKMLVLCLCQRSPKDRPSSTEALVALQEGLMPICDK